MDIRLKWEVHVHCFVHVKYQLLLTFIEIKQKKLPDIYMYERSIVCLLFIYVSLYPTSCT